MNRRISYWILFPTYSIILAGVLTAVFWGSKAVTVLSEQAPVKNRTIIFIDPGHGGEDGGASSCTGIHESTFNLEISLRLRDLLHLLGVKTVLSRSGDQDLHTEGRTIGARKVSDMHNRVKLINASGARAIISIHQNHFSNSKYYGAQVFYAKTSGSKELAEKIQQCFTTHLNRGASRKIKPAKSIFIMDHIKIPGVLVECGFISNPAEEKLLRCPDYQKNLICVIGCSTLSTLNYSSPLLDQAQHG